MSMSLANMFSLTKRGRNYFGLCPFHGEQTPSFSVTQEKQIFHCFGCGAGGNVITFLMDIENISFPDAVVKLGERIGIHIEVHYQLFRSKSTCLKRSRTYEKAHEFASEYYHHLLSQYGGRRKCITLFRRKRVFY